MFKLRTKQGYDFYEVASVIQKAIRRGDKLYATYFALEMFASGYSKYLWKRLYTISAEDCYGIITKEVEALYNGFEFVNKNAKEEKGRIFITKAVVLLCDCKKSRETDHLQCLSYDNKIFIDDDVITSYIKEVSEKDKLDIPEYTFDVHTLRGKRAGKTKKDFFIQEHNALNNRQTSIFDDIIKEGAI